MKQAVGVEGRYSRMRGAAAVALPVVLTEAELTTIFKALSDETRRRILLLVDERDRSVGELVDHFQISQPSVSRHLAILRRAGLVSGRRSGQRVFYRLRPDMLLTFMRDFPFAPGLSPEAPASAN